MSIRRMVTLSDATNSMERLEGAADKLAHSKFLIFDDLIVIGSHIWSTCSYLQFNDWLDVVISPGLKRSAWRIRRSRDNPAAFNQLNTSLNMENISNAPSPLLIADYISLLRRPGSPAAFYGDTLDLDLIINQEMASIHRAADHAFIGIVDEA